MGCMCKLVFLLTTVVVVLVAYGVHQVLNDIPPMPHLPHDQWWGIGEARELDKSIRPFQIQFPPEAIKDLHTSLDRFLKRRATPPLENQGFQYGFNTDYLTKVISYWRSNYQWKEREKYLNQFPHFKTNIQGLDIHFIRVTPKTSSNKKVVPLLLMHGWPGSVREFYDLIPLLTTPRDDADFVFDVVAPSLPGYGFSEGAARPGLGAAQVAVVMKNLMHRIGFDKFYIQGGDWGSVIGSHLATLFPEVTLGVHLNACGAMSAKTILMWTLGSYYPPLVVEEKFKHKMYPATDILLFIMEEMGYCHLQGTKPDTIGSVLGDTPAGLAAYILEKFSTWTNKDWRNLPDGGLTKKYTLDALLDNIMVYWVTGSITTSQRLYAETFSIAQQSLRIDLIPLRVPSACSRFHNDLLWQPDLLLKTKFTNLLQVTDHVDGGHFAAFEEPKLLSQDIWTAVSKFELVHRGTHT